MLQLHDHFVQDSGLKSKDKTHTCPRNRVCVARLDAQYGILAVEVLKGGEVSFRIESRKTNRPSRISVQIEERVHIDLEEGQNEDAP
jgi:hypothetical protein